MIRRHTALIATTANLMVIGCAADFDSPTGTELPALTEEERALAMRMPSDDAQQLELVLRAGEPTQDPKEPPETPKAPTQPLEDSAAKSLLERVGSPSSPVETTFRLPPQSPPPPVAAEAEPQRFPPSTAQPSGPDEVPVDAPLEVLRITPKGHVRSAHAVQILFNRAAGPLGASPLPKQPTGVNLSPETAGTWRWLDPATLIFEPKGQRFPAATQYTVEVTPRLTASDGTHPIKKSTTRFTTPAPEIVRFHPRRKRNDVSTRPVMLLFFNQSVSAQVISSSAQLTVGTRDGPALRLATQEEIQADGYAARNYPRDSTQRVVALIPESHLPPSSEARLTVRAGPWSTEGQLPAEAPFRSAFNTRGPLELSRITCGGWGEACRPGDPMMLNFVNQLAPAHQQPSTPVTVEPSVDNVHIEVNPYGIGLSGDFKALTTYQVQLHPELRDEHGQELGARDPISVDIKAPHPSFSTGPESVIRVSPSNPQLPIYSINTPSLDVKVRSVKSADWPRWVENARKRSGQKAKIGKKVLEQALTVSPPLTESQRTLLPLTGALDDAPYGMATVEVTGPGYRREQQTNRHWVVISDVLLDAWHSGDDSLYVSASRPDGSPIANLNVQIKPRGPEGRTNDDGLAKIDLPRKANGIWLSTEQGGFLPGSAWGTNSAFQASKPTETRLSVLTIDDRGLYRPGETAFIKGFVRRFAPEKGLQSLPDGTKVRYRVTISGSKPIAEGDVTVGSHGSFALELKLPRESALGYAQAALELRSGGLETRHIHSFQVQEFRRSRFEVDLSASAPPHLVGKTIRANLSAQAYSGGPVGQAEVDWTVTEENAYYSPPGWSDWRFGKSRPWWWHLSPTEAEAQRFESETDASGHAQLRIDTLRLREPFPVNLHIFADVADRDRRRFGATETVLVHPSHTYVGIKLPKLFINEGEKIEPQFVVVDLEGEPVAKRSVTLKLYPSPGYSPNVALKEPPVAECKQLSTSEPTVCSIEAQSPGRYVLRAEVTDTQGRTNGTEVLVYWSGQAIQESVRLLKEVVELAPDRETYAPGDYAKITVRSPIANARGYWWTVSDTIQRFEAIELKGDTAQLELPINRRLTPNFQVNVWLVGGSKDAPREARGSITLRSIAKQDILQLDVRPRHTATQPGQETSVEVSVTSAKGSPVANAEVTLAVVDEAVLAASGSVWPEPVEALWQERNTYLRSWHTRPEWVRTSTETGVSGRQSPRLEARRGPVETSMMKMESAGNLADASPPSPPIRVDFRPNAHFSAHLTTDKDGKVISTFTLPDDLTRYRIRAVAATKGRRFGRGEASFVTQKALSIEPGLPRFLSLGDEVELPFIVRNQTDAPLPFSVAVRAHGLALKTPHAVTSTVGPHSSLELRFPAIVKPGDQAVVRALVTADGHEDAVESSVPVYAPTVREAFADYGSVEEGALARILAPPSKPIPGVGGLTIEVAPTRLLSAQDAYTQLINHPHRSNEQRASRLIAYVTSRRFADIFGAQEPSVETAHKAQMQADFEQLMDSQRPDGGWGYWPRAVRPDSFLTAHVVHALLRLRQAHADKQSPLSEKHAYALESALNRAMTWLEQLPRYITTLELAPAISASIQAHALWVRALGKQELRAKDLQLALELGGGYQRAPTEVLAWLYGAAIHADWTEEAEAFQTALDNRFSLTAKTAHLESSYPQGGHRLLFGESRADAIYLIGALAHRPEDPILEKVLQGLLSGKRASGGWRHTQENAWALLAVTEYAEQKERAPVKFTGRAWVSDTLSFETSFSGRNAPRSTVIPTDWLTQHLSASSSRLVLSKQGSGRMYYRLGWTYVDQDLRSTSANHGFAVSRTFEAVDDPEDVQKTDQGWTVRAGARVRVKIEVAASGPRHHVAVLDRLPAGFEALHPETHGGPSMPIQPDEDGPANLGRWWTWDHEALRDTGAETFATDLEAGIHRYAYLVRATTPGRFVAGPTLVEEMYAPETHGRSASDQVTISAKD